MISSQDKPRAQDANPGTPRTPDGVRGKLFIVGTPIGNMEDITLRALRALREADIIAAEDTRRTGQLLVRHGIHRHSPPSEGLGVGKLTERARRPRYCSPPPEGVSPVGQSRDHVAERDTWRPSRGPGVGKSPRLISYHQFNEAKRTQELLKELQQGRTVALVTDAGMPTISDPGQRLIQAVLEYNGASTTSPSVGRAGPARRSPPAEGLGVGPPPNHERGTVNQEPETDEIPRQARNDRPIELEIIPGPSAVTMAIAASGISGAGVSPVNPPGGFLFYGFLPHKSTQRRRALTLLAPLPYTLVFFESPYRLIKSLRDMHELLGNRRAVVARELTKKFEEILRGDLATILKKLENRSVKGEITVVVEGHEE